VGLKSNDKHPWEKGGKGHLKVGVMNPADAGRDKGGSMDPADSLILNLGPPEL
jgi:hypothetical protein